MLLSVLKYCGKKCIELVANCVATVKKCDAMALKVRGTISRLICYIRIVWNINNKRRDGPQ